MKIMAFIYVLPLNVPRISVMANGGGGAKIAHYRRALMALKSGYMALYGVAWAWHRACVSNKYLLSLYCQSIVQSVNEQPATHSPFHCYLE